MAAINTKVKKAVIPVAGLGTRMLPATKAIPKEMLPLVDKRMNVLRLALLKLCWLHTHLKTLLKTTLIPVLNWKQCWKNV